MHLSIISYALDVPSVNLVWNDKIPFFYQNIGYPDRAISIEDWNAEDVLKRLSEMENDSSYTPDKDYLMSLYDFIFSVIRDFIGVSADSFAKYDFEDVKKELINNPVSLQKN